MQVELPKERPPTTLHLFNFSQKQTDISQDAFRRTRRLMNEFSNVADSIERSNVATQNRLQRLIEVGKDLDSHEVALLSSQTYSAFFLKLREELILNPPHIGENEFMDFFYKCVDINLVIGHKRDKEVEAIVNQMSDNIPSWFNGDIRRWKLFLVDHSTFPQYLNSEHISGQKKLKKSGRIAADDAKLLGLVVRGETPDWMEKEGFPNISEVEAEMEEDRFERLRGFDEARKAEAQIRKIHQYQEDINKKSLLWIEKRKDTAFPSINEFPNIVTYIWVVSGYGKLDTKDKAIEDLTSLEIMAHIKTNTGSDTILRSLEVLPSQPLLGKEFVALWIENYLINEGIVTSTQNSLTKQTISTLSSMLKGYDEIKKEDIPKKLYYEVRPLVALLSDSEKQYLRELMEDSVGNTTEYIIWEFAEAISARLKTAQSDINEQQTKTAIKHLGEFTQKWLRKNYEWAYQQLKSSVRSSFEADQSATSISRIEEAEAVIKSDSETDDTMEIAIQGNLSGWKLYLLPEIDVDTLEPVELSGNDLAAKQKWLEDYISVNKVSHDGKISSLINAIDWLVTVPQETEQIRMYKDVKGRRYKKLKRGGMRILYQLSTEDKTIQFHPHKKKDWSYGF